MNNHNILKDDEIVYRRIPVDLKDVAYSIVNGEIKILPAAFNDRRLSPSLYRAKLINYDATLVQLKVEDGIIELKTSCIHKIDNVTTKHGGKIMCNHSVRVVAEPIPIDDPTVVCAALSPAHAIASVDPKFFGKKQKQKNAFQLLRISLANLSNKNCLLIEPTAS